MKQISVNQAIKTALSHAKGNRKEIEVSKSAECFSCVRIFDAKEITEWKDEWVDAYTINRVERWTAICPKCSNTTVIGSASGLLVDQAYTVIIHDYMKEDNVKN